MSDLGVGWDLSSIDLSGMPGLPEIVVPAATQGPVSGTFDPATGMYMGGGPSYAPGNPARPGSEMDGDSPNRPVSPEDARIRQVEEELRRFREQQAEMVARQQRDARDTIKRVLAQYNLDSLSDYLWKQYTEQYVDVSNPDAIVFTIKEQEAYKRRFAGNAARVSKGLPELDPSTYLQMEDSYRQVLRSNGMPDGFYDSVEDFTKFIEGDVSAAELNDRLQEGYRVVADADQEVKNQMSRLYGVTESQLAAYFIDPERAKPYMMASDYQRQARSAQIAARAQEQGGISLTGDLAEELARRGVTAAEAQQGFQEIGNLGELRQQFSGEEALTQDQLVRQQFGADVQAQQALDRRRRSRVGEFQGGGRFAATQGETSGALRLGVGQAQ
jgi:hypothetical protein